MQCALEHQLKNAVLHVRCSRHASLLHSLQALRRASNVSEAVDVIGDLSSDSDSDGSPAFHDANESLPEGGGWGRAGQGFRQGDVGNEFETHNRSLSLKGVALAVLQSVCSGH